MDFNYGASIEIFGKHNAFSFNIACKSIFLSSLSYIYEFDCVTGLRMGRFTIPMLKDGDFFMKLVTIMNEGEEYLIGTTLLGVIISWKIKKYQLEYVSNCLKGFSSFSVISMNDNLVCFHGNATSNNLSLICLNPRKDLENLKIYDDLIIPVKAIRKKYVGIVSLSCHTSLPLIAIGSVDGAVLIFDMHEVTIDWNKDVLNWKLICIIDSVSNECILDINSTKWTEPPLQKSNIVTHLTFHPSKPILMVGNNLGGDLISVQVTNSVVLGLSKSISNQNFAFHFHPFLSFALCLRKPNENLLNLDVLDLSSAKLDAAYSYSLESNLNRPKSLNQQKAASHYFIYHEKYNLGAFCLDEKKLQLFSLRLLPNDNLDMIPVAPTVTCYLEDFVGPIAKQVDSFLFTRQLPYNGDDEPPILEIVSHNAVDHQEIVLTSFPCAPPIGDSVVLVPLRMATSFDNSISIIFFGAIPFDPILEHWYAVVQNNMKNEGELMLRQCVDAAPVNQNSWLEARDEGKILILKTDVQELQRWPMASKVRRIFVSPLKVGKVLEDLGSPKGSMTIPVILYAVKSAAGLETLVYSCNKLENMSPTDLKQLTLKEGFALQLNENEITNSVQWQGGKGVYAKDKLACVLTNQRLFIMNVNCEILNSIPSYRGSHKGCIVSFIWMKDIILFSTTTMVVEYITLSSTSSRFLCSLDNNNSSSAKLVYACHDRLVYSATRKKGISSLLFRPLLPLEPLVIGILESCPADSSLIKEEVMQFVCRFGFRFSSANNNEGITADSGITLSTIASLSSSGFTDLAYFIAKSSEHVGVFLQRPQISTQLKALLASNLKLWDESLIEILSDDPSLLEYANNTNGLGSILPDRNSPVSKILGRLGILAILCGNLEFGRKCLDIAGDDIESVSLLASMGTKGKLLLKKFQTRSKIPNLPISILSSLILNKDVESDPSHSLLSLPRRRGSLIKIETSETLPVYALEKPPIIIPNISTRPPPIESKMKPFALETVQSWIGLPRPLAGDAKSKSRESVDGGIDSIIAAASGGSGGGQSGNSIALARLDGEEAVMGYWRFEEEEEKHNELKVVDISKSNITGSLEGSVKYIDSTCPCDQGDPKKVMRQWAVEMGGEKACLRISVVKGENLDIGFYQPVDRSLFTLEFWINIEEKNSNIILASRVDSLEGASQWEIINNETALAFSVNGGGIIKSPSDSITRNVWSHIAVTVDASDNDDVKVCMYVNGGVVCEGAVKGPTFIFEGNSEIVFGYKVKCLITEIRMWSVVRRSSDVSDFHSTHLDLAMKKKIKVQIHSRDCTCEKCESRRNANTEKDSFNLGLTAVDAGISLGLGGGLTAAKRVRRGKKEEAPAVVEESKLPEKKVKKKGLKKDAEKKDDIGDSAIINDNISTDSIAISPKKEVEIEKVVATPPANEKTTPLVSPIAKENPISKESPIVPTKESPALVTKEISLSPSPEKSSNLPNPTFSSSDPNELVQIALAAFQKGAFGESLKALDYTIHVLLTSGKGPVAIKAQLAFCIKYKLALKLIEAIKLKKYPEPFCAVLAKRAAQIPLQPAHRSICTKIAADFNIKIGNYGHAADILEPFITDPSAKKLFEVCVERGKANVANVSGECPNCSVSILASDAKCNACNIDLRYCYLNQSLISSSYFVTCTICSSLFDHSVNIKNSCNFCGSENSLLLKGTKK